MYCSSTMKIVVVEDNQVLQDSIKKVLTDEGHFIEVFADGESARRFCMIEREAIDLMIVDYMLPELDGVELITALRQESISTPIIMLTAKGEVRDKVAGLESGADYYLTKPFEFDELLACIGVMRRRPANYQSEQCEVQAGLMFDFALHKLTKDGKVVQLTPTEYSILECLVRRRGQPVSQREIGEHVFDFAKENWSNTIEVHIKNLRKKLERDNYENPIKTIRGVGYTVEKQ